MTSSSSLVKTVQNYRDPKELSQYWGKYLKDPTRRKDRYKVTKAQEKNKPHRDI